MTLGVQLFRPNPSVKAVRGDFSMLAHVWGPQQELLQHLVTNLQQPIVVCGPTGIGKTSLLKSWQEQRAGAYRFCLLNCNVELSLDAVLDAIDQTLRQTGNNLADKVGTGKKLVLILDEAGELNSGLAHEIIEFAANKPLLSVVFVLSHDELYIKNLTDHLMDDCYLIEIPPLTEQQCGEFLSGLVTKRQLGWSNNTLDDHYIASVYRKTHGIPGRVVALFPAINLPKQADNTWWQLGGAIVLLVAITLALQWFSQKPNGLQIVLPFMKTAPQQPSSGPGPAPQQP